MTRVVVTGLGAMTSLGLGFEPSWRNLCAGVSGIERISSFDASGMEVQIAGEVRGFDPAAYMDAKAARRMDRFSQLAIAAAGEALRDADLDVTAEPEDRVGVMLNTGGGGIQTLVREALNFHEKGPKGVSPFTIPMVTPNMAACLVSITYGIRGPVLASVAACSAGTQAFVDALRLIRLGEVDVMVTGGTEALLGIAIIAMGNMGVLSRRNDEPARASRPFDRDRDGCVLGEGSAVMVLESEAHARRRGARIYAELAGGAMTADAFHISAPAPGGAGAARAMTKALTSARVTPRDVDLIYAHGTSTSLNDVSETAAIKSTFGHDAHRVPISATKSMIGHPLGASGAISCVASVLSIRDSVIPPTINLDTADPECDLDYVPNQARTARVDTAMVNAFGFGGQNAVAVFRRYED
ncbi:MAG TPA: beta-ketoacyl-ACP synthase II [Chloroflexota bacterium]|nr:beta-ketoacyl-ACP synthase II [Chloroflexota bacterium]